MLIHMKTGREVKPENLPKGKARVAVLAACREVFVQPRKHGDWFTIQKRARLTT